MAEITRLQRMKTAALICFSSEAGAILGKASQPMRNAVAAFVQELGLAYQIADELRDAEGDAAEMGKAAGKDATRGKSTIVSVLGADRARAHAKALLEQAVRHLDLFGEKADFLRAAAEFVITRRA